MKAPAARRRARRPSLSTFLGAELSRHVGVKMEARAFAFERAVPPRERRRSETKRSRSTSARFSVEVDATRSPERAYV